MLIQALEFLSENIMEKVLATYIFKLDNFGKLLPYSQAHSIKKLLKKN